MNHSLNPSGSILEAIASQILTNEIRRKPSADMNDTDACISAADSAYSMIIYSDEARRVMLEDEGFDTEDDSGSVYAKVNTLDASSAFALGFDLALQLGARIAVNPLAEHELSDVLGASKRTAAKWIYENRGDALKQKRKAREMSAAR
jgi:hypothetical protein